MWDKLPLLSSTLKELILENVQIGTSIIRITELFCLETLFIDSEWVEDEFFLDHIEMKMGNQYYYYSSEQLEEPIELFPGYKLTSLKSLTLKSFATCLAKSFSFKNQKENHLTSLSLDYDTFCGVTFYENFTFLKKDYFKQVTNLSIKVKDNEGYKLKESDLFQFTKLEKLELHNLHFKEQEQEKSTFSLLKENATSLIHLDLVNCNLNLEYLYLCTKIL